MKTYLTLLIAFFTVFGYSQSRFELPKGTDQEKIPFTLMSNLVIIPVEINGVALDFLLDTGVNATILFSLENKDSIELNNASPIKLRGLGNGKPIEAVKSTQNTLSVGNAVNRNQTVFIIFDQELNFSPRLGKAVHGIIGYDFFKDFVVETNYVKEQLIITRPGSYRYSKCKRCFDAPLTFYKNKPYLDIEVTLENEPHSVTLLLDSGSGDALWLFKDKEPYLIMPKKSFKDFLGLGLSGNIFGERTKIKTVSLGSYNLSSVNTAFPDKEAFANINLFPERDGSMGGEMLRRFTTVIDYTNKRLRLRRNRYFGQPFYYNMCGLTLQHKGFEYVKERLPNYGKSRSIGQNNAANEIAVFETQRLYAIKLAPKYEISEVREGSPAAIAGMLKGDVLVTLNGQPAHRFGLEEINSMFHSKEGRKITFSVLRNGLTYNFSIKLKRVI
ncbi:MAG: aspartyl protease family protein [Gilvibacter sp.]